jgi:uncharacterized damage-inducible protein DinB
MISELITIYKRDLKKLEDEINAFADESNLWKITGNVKNSSGNLCLHLVGNLNTYLGKNLGNTGYIRNRPAEFSTKGISKAQLTNMISDTSVMVQQVLSKLKNEDLQHNYPEQVLGYEMTTGFFLLHLCAHLSWHMGQINYLRRILE